MGRKVSEEGLVADVVMDWLLLHGAGPMSCEEIAEATGMRRNHVRVVVAQALGKVRRVLEERGMGEEELRRCLR